MVDVIDVAAPIIAVILDGRCRIVDSNPHGVGRSSANVNHHCRRCSVDRRRVLACRANPRCIVGQLRSQRHRPLLSRLNVIFTDAAPIVVKPVLIVAFTVVTPVIVEPVLIIAVSSSRSRHRSLFNRLI